MASSYSLAQLIVANVIVAVVAVCITIVATVAIMKRNTASKSTPNNTVAVATRSTPRPTQPLNNCAERPPLTKFPDVISNSDLETATMEAFLSNMAKEKPLRFGAQHLRDFTHNFSTKLGSGAFGVVYKGTFPSGVRIAVKCLNSSLGTRSLAEQFMAEVATMGRTYHVNLVRLYGFCFDPSLQALVYEYMENGSLDRLLFSNEYQVKSSIPLPDSNSLVFPMDNQRFLKWEKLMEIAVGTAKGIAYLHEECEHRIIHYDIKPGNVLLDSNLNPKVADFGLAKLCNRDSVHVELYGMKGTPGYAAPEVWMPYPVTCKCDVYSFGMLLFEIVGRRRNYLDGGGGGREWLPGWVYEKVERKEVEEMLSSLGIVEEEVREKVERAAIVALWCVQYLPSARPKMSDVVRMLEGGVEIPTPPNPFAHLVDDGSKGSFSFSSSTPSG